MIKTTLYLLVAVLAGGDEIVLDKGLELTRCEEARAAGLVFKGPALRHLQGAELSCKPEDAA